MARDRMQADQFSDVELVAEITHIENRWRDLRRLLEESGGGSGSPGEWLWERLGELQYEQTRRATPTHPAAGDE